MSPVLFRLLLLSVLTPALWSGCAGLSETSAPGLPPPRLSSSRTSSTTTAWPIYTLRAAETWQLNPPNGERFDASGLLWTPQGHLLTVNDRGSSLYRIEFQANSPSAALTVLTNCFAASELARFASEKIDRYDCEGIAQDEQGRLYLCEELNRWVLRCDPHSGQVERLEIDWSAVQKHFDRIDPNASFEGIAVGGGKLYLANERKTGRIIVVDLESLQVVSDFAVRPHGSRARDLHYSDLAWFEGTLWVLLRESRCVLQVDPERRQVLGEFNFRDMEEHREVSYHRQYPTGAMEGLAVDGDYLWLVTDNNGMGRVRYPKDLRPTLFKCPRPDLRVPTAQ